VADSLLRRLGEDRGRCWPGCRLLSTDARHREGYAADCGAFADDLDASLEWE
jgi:hypothetical protein